MMIMIILCCLRPKPKHLCTINYQRITVLNNKLKLLIDLSEKKKDRCDYRHTI